LSIAFGSLATHLVRPVARQFLREHENAVLATWRRDGRLQVSPVTVGLDAAGWAIIASRETTYKVRNLRRDPCAALCVFVEAFTGPWVQIEGTAEVVPLPEATEPLVDYYRRLAGEHPDWEDYHRAMTADRRALICITIERAGPDRQG
jgi:PPOX class probable F420-dependent enzyme